MEKILKTMTTALICVAIMFSCTKPENGKDGRDGKDGTNGANGKDGAKILSAWGVPTAVMGAVGDFYFDTEAKDLYGPKTGAGWGTPTSLTGGANGAQGPTGPEGAAGPMGATGATGAAGADGNKILSGSGAPNNAVGAVGDWYINTANARLYGPKEASGWSASYVDLTGTTGLQGPQGPAGPQGPQGPTGPQGPQGIPGNAGTMMYTWGSRTFTQLTSYILPFAIEDAEKSLIYAYFKPSISNSWFSIPGLFSSSSYETMISIGQSGTTSSRFDVYLRNASDRTSYMTTVTWTDFRIIVVPIPDANIIPLASAAGSMSKGAPAVDFNDYAAVAKYYGLPN